MGWQTAKVDRAQLRPAVGFENGSPDPSDIRALRRAERNLIDNNVEDLRDEAPPDDEPIVPEVSHFEDDQWFQETEEQPQADMLLLPEAIAGYQRSEPPSLPASRRVSQLTADSAAALPFPQLPGTDSSQKSGSEAQAAAAKRPAEQQPPEEGQEAKRVALERPAQPSVSEAPASVSQAPPSLLLEETSPGFYELEPGWDGSSPLRRGKPKTSLLPEVFEQEHYSDRLPSESDDEVEDSHHNWRTCYAAEQADLVNPEQLTRKEQKAMDREIPWREIVST